MERLHAIWMVFILYVFGLFTLGVLGWLLLGLPGLAAGLAAGYAAEGIQHWEWRGTVSRVVREGQAPEIDWVRPDVGRLAGALGLPVPEIGVINAAPLHENAYFAFSPWCPRRSAKLILEIGWIRKLPEQVVCAVIAHELGHATARSLACTRAGSLVRWTGRLAVFGVGVLAAALGAGQAAWVAFPLALMSGSVDLTCVWLGRRAETFADDVAIELGYGSELDQWMIWAGYHFGHRRLELGSVLASHPLIRARRARIARRLAVSPDRTPSPTYDGARWHFPPNRLSGDNWRARLRMRRRSTGARPLDKRD